MIIFHQPLVFDPTPYICQFFQIRVELQTFYFFASFIFTHSPSYNQNIFPRHELASHLSEGTIYVIDESVKTNFIIHGICILSLAILGFHIFLSHLNGVIFHVCSILPPLHLNSFTMCIQPSLARTMHQLPSNRIAMAIIQDGVRPR